MIKNKIAVIGAGKWGQALHHIINQNTKCLISSRTKRDLPNFVEMKEALNSEILVITIATQEIREWLKNNFIDCNQKILIASKGIERNTNKLPLEIYKDFVEEDRLSYLSGPTFAAEVMNNKPTAMVVSTKDKLFFNQIKDLLTLNNTKVYHSEDIVGAEIAGAYKNVLAIASGICKGLDLGQNAEAALLARGLIEMNRFGEEYIKKTIVSSNNINHSDTFLGLSGAGDLFLTASSTLSRNYRVGLGLATNKSIEQIIEELGEVAEGIETTYALTNLSSQYDIYTPIADEVKNILEGKSVIASINDLMS